LNTASEALDKQVCRVALVTETLDEKGGGITSAVCDLADALCQSGVEVAVFALHSDVKGSLPRRPNSERVEVHLCSYSRGFSLDGIRASSLRRMLSAYCERHPVDLIHAHGLWLPNVYVARSVAKRFALPFVLSPHGFLQPWAVQYKAVKKRLAWHIYGKQCVQDAMICVASEDERLGVRAMGVMSPVALMPNIVPVPDVMPAKGYRWGRENIMLFMSRIHRSKGLLDLIEAWAVVRPTGWKLVIAGHDEEGHTSEVSGAIRRHALGAEVILIGPVPYADRWQLYAEADIFSLPTYSENFGIVVAEALAARVPVITTHAAPWAVLNSLNCGWWVPCGKEFLVEALLTAFQKTPSELAAMGRVGRKHVLGAYSRERVALQLLAAYRWHAAGGEKPECIQ